MFLRRAAVFAAGISIAAGVGLAGVGAASAAAQAVHVKNGATWTIEVNGGKCQLDVLLSNGSFTSSDPQFGGDAGTWRGGGSTITMKWTAGYDTGLKFAGVFTTSTNPPEYTGTFGGTVRQVTGQLVEGAVAGC